jgi:dTDP-4-amino-4,6-dideoxygalactose transaminase
MKKSKILPFFSPAIGREELAQTVEALRSDWITTGPKTKKFEENFSKYLGTPDALALNSCTAALHLALLASGIKPGDKVITTPMTFCAGVNVIEHAGAKPVLVDIEPDTLNIDPEKIKQALKKHKAKAVIAVHYGGHPCDMNSILKLSRKHGVKVIEDAAHALPAKYKGRFVGTIGDLTAFSFYATKNLTTAEGGMLTGKPELIEKARALALHGMNRNAWNRYGQGGSWQYDVTAAGFKYNMPDVLAAIGLAQLKKLPGFQKKRKEIAAFYSKVFSPMPELEVPAVRPEVEHAWHLYPLRLNLRALTISRDRFIDELQRRGISTSVHFIPVHLFSYYRKKYGFKPQDFPVALEQYARLISLPFHPRLTGEDLSRVISAVSEIVRKFKR